MQISGDYCPLPPSRDKTANGLFEGLLELALFGVWGVLIIRETDRASVGPPAPSLHFLLSP